MIYDVVKKNRSYRRFYQDRSMPENTLKDLVELARLAPSAANLQPFKFILSYTPDMNSLIFPCLAWAAYLKDWDGPEEGEKPSAYIVILSDTGITSNFSVSHGIAAQCILLGATEMGYGGCIIGSIQREKLRTQLAIP